MGKLNQRGGAHILSLLVVIAAVGIISYLLISSTAPTKNGLFGLLNPKPQSHAATVTNLITNGGFESGLSGWTLNRSGDTSTTISTNSPHSGTQMLHISGGGGGVMLQLNAQANTTYMVTYWVRVNAGTSCSGDCWGGFSAALWNFAPALTSNNNSLATLPSGEITPSGLPVGQWVKESIQFTTGSSNSTGQFIIQPFGGAGWNFNIDFDDVMYFVKPSPDNPPTVSIASNVSSVSSLPGAVNFSSVADDVDGNVQYYFWDFGDGGHSNSANPAHTYLSNGTYTATIRVYDNDGSSSSATTTITVNDPSYPTITINSPPSSVTSPTLSLSGTAVPGNGGTISKVTWSTDRGLSGTASGTTAWSAAIDLTGMGGKNRILIDAVDNSGRVAKSDFIVNYTPPSAVSVVNGAAGVTTNTNSPQEYDKFEATFSIQNSQSSNPYFPYDTALTDGMATLNGTGITVNSVFTSPTGKIYSQPGFLYQPFTRNTAAKTLVAIGNPVWKVRFSPSELGIWSYKLQISDASGTTTLNDPTLTFTAIAPTNPNNHGFLHASQKDPRYFEFTDGTSFIGVGPTAHLQADSFSLDTSLSQIATGSANFSRDGLGNSSVVGSSWAPWSAGANHEAAETYPGVDLTTDEAYGDHVYSLHLSTDTTVSDPCVFYNFYGPTTYVKPNTNYRVSLRLKTVGVTGSGGFTFRPGATWPSNGCSTFAGQPLTIPYQTGSNDWHLVTVIWNSQSNTTIGDALLTLENVTAGDVYIDEVSIKEDLGNGQFGPEVMARSNFNVQDYYSQQPSWNWDYGLDQFAQRGLYDKVILEQKSEFTYGHISPYGYGFAGGGQNGLFGAPLTLQQYFWRYVTARWGYSRAVHSWEYANEQAPGDLTMADRLANYIHQFDPQHHMADTSNWGGITSGGSYFWQNDKIVDLADAHIYVDAGAAGQGTTSWLGETDPTTGGSLTDTSLFVIAHSMDVLKNNAAGNKPMVVGEVGIGNTADTIVAGNNDTDTQGVWWHQFIWPQMNPGALYYIYWYDANLQKNPSLYNLAKPYRNFMEGKSTDPVNTRIPLNNGNYKDIVLTFPTGVNGTGQKDIINGGAHFWAYSTGYAWTTPTGGSSLAGQSFSFTGMPAKNYTIEFWDTWNNTVTTQSLNFGGGTMTLTVPAGFSQKDVAVKIYPATGYIAAAPDPTPTPQPSSTLVPTSTPNPSQSPTSTPSLTCGGADLDHDGKVFLSDYNILVGNFNKTGVGASGGDIDGDGKVFLSDYNILVGNFNKTGC